MIPMLCAFCGYVEVGTDVVQMGGYADGPFNVLSEHAPGPREGELWLCPHCGQIMILRSGSWIVAPEEEIAKLPREVIKRIERMRPRN